MSPAEFRAMLKAEREKEAMAKSFGLPPYRLDGYSWTVEVKDDHEKNSRETRIQWSPSVPDGIPNHGDSATVSKSRIRSQSTDELYGVKRLSVDDQEIIIERLNKMSLIPGDRCPVCGGEQELEDYLTKIAEGMDIDGFTGSIWAALTVCRDCGFIRQFSPNAYAIEGKPSAKP